MCTAMEVQATDESGVQGIDKLDVSALSSKLSTVVNWHQLGLNFGLLKQELDKIEQDYQEKDVPTKAGNVG